MPVEKELKETKVLNEDELEKVAGGDSLTTYICPYCNKRSVYDNTVKKYNYCVTPGCTYKMDHS